MSRVLLYVAAACMLSACALTPNRTWQSLKTVWSEDGVRHGPLDPRFEYLDLRRGVNHARLVLGYRWPSPDTLEGRGQVRTQWYSSAGETLSFVDGRLQQSLGTAVEWRAMFEHERPSWSQVLEAARPIAWLRERDEMPGYRIGLREQVLTQRLAVGDSPPAEGLAALGDQSSTVVWVRDDVRARLPDGRPWVHAQWFALKSVSGAWIVRWSRQCLAPDWCLELLPLDKARL